MSLSQGESRPYVGLSLASAAKPTSSQFPKGAEQYDGADSSAVVWSCELLRNYSGGDGTQANPTNWVYLISARCLANSLARLLTHKQTHNLLRPPLESANTLATFWASAHEITTTTITNCACAQRTR